MSQLIEGRDYEIIDEGMGDLKSYLAQTSSNAIKKAIRVADRALSGHKGKAATMAILMAELATDKQAFNNAYKKHSDAINEYFEYVDLKAVSALMGVEEAVAKAAPAALVKGATVLAAGILIGIGGLSLLNRKKT